jgi:hypothetical protein
MARFKTLRTRAPHRHDRGVASLLLLFAMTAFSFLGLATLMTPLADEPLGTSLTIMRGVQDESTNTRFVATPITVPGSWRAPGSSGKDTLELGVIVPDDGNVDNGASAARHDMTDSEIPGMTVCCESRTGACSERSSSPSEIAEWTPTADNARWMSLNLGSQAAADGKADVITATIAAAAAEISTDAAPIACQLEYRGSVIAKGVAHLRQQLRTDGVGLPTDKVEGTFDIAVRTN